MGLKYPLIMNFSTLARLSIAYKKIIKYYERFIDENVLTLHYSVEALIRDRDKT